jgi:ubiquinone/menaquinone biosynthesis C-methylase UbiE
VTPPSRAEGRGGAARPPGADPYPRYLRRFFARWSRAYDLFAAAIGFAYAAAAREAAASPRLRIVDLCTGTGEVAWRCVRRGGCVTAVDFTPEMLLRARRKPAAAGVRWLWMDARFLAFPDASFDVAVLSFALHDMPRQARRDALREAARVATEIVVLDYEPPAGGWARRAMVGLLATVEAAYWRGFARDGGVAAAARDAGLEARRVARPLPGFCAIWRLAGDRGPKRHGTAFRPAR